MKLKLTFGVELEIETRFEVELEIERITLNYSHVRCTNDIFRPYSFSKIVGFEAEIAKNDRRGSQTRDKSTVLLSMLSISIVNQISDPIRHLIGRLG